MSDSTGVAGTGAEYPVRYEIVELVEPELIVLRCPPMPEGGLPEGTVTRVEFHDHGGKTRMILSDGPTHLRRADMPRAAGRARSGSSPCSWGPEPHRSMSDDAGSTETRVVISRFISSSA